VLRRRAERLVIRPSGTEPKLKAYLEVVEPVPDAAALVPARAAAQRRLAGLRAEVERLLAG
jgi:phosphomannomutase